MPQCGEILSALSQQLEMQSAEAEDQMGGAGGKTDGQLFKEQQNRMTAPKTMQDRLKRSKALADGLPFKSEYVRHSSALAAAMRRTAAEDELADAGLSSKDGTPPLYAPVFLLTHQERGENVVMEGDKVRFQGVTHSVEWVDRDEDLADKSRQATMEKVEETIAGLVTLSNGESFRNPSVLVDDSYARACKAVARALAQTEALEASTNTQSFAYEECLHTKSPSNVRPGPQGHI